MTIRKWIRRAAVCFWLTAFFCFLAEGTYYPNMVFGPVKQLAPGVTWQTAVHTDPTWSIQILEIHMANRNVELIPVFKAAGNVSGSANERTSVLAKRVDAVAAVNAGYFTTDGTRLTTSYTLIDGHFIGGAGAAMAPEHNRSVLGFSGNHQAIPKRTKLSNSFIPAHSADWDKIVNAIGGRGHFVTNNGVLVTQDNEGTTTSHYGSRQPRTAIGFSTTPYRAWLVTVDGRQSGFSDGMTYTELGRLMADLDIEESISLDGGGSTTAWVRGKGVVNSPSGESERMVVSAWAVVPSQTMDNTSDTVTTSGVWTLEEGATDTYHTDHLLNTEPATPSSVTWTPDLARDGLYKVCLATIIPPVDDSYFSRSLRVFSGPWIRAIDPVFWVTVMGGPHGDRYVHSTVCVMSVMPSIPPCFSPCGPGSSQR